MGCTGSKATEGVVERPSELPPAIDLVKARENAKPTGGTVYAFGECPDKSNEKQKKYLIFYLIRVKLVDPETGQSFQSVVYRRFSQFEIFRQRLLKSRKFERIPALPKKKMFGKTNKNNEYLSQRRKDLCVWFDQISEMENMLSDEDYILFLTQDADVQPEDIAVQETDPIVLQGEDAEASDPEEESDVDEEPTIRAVSGVVYALGRCPDETHPGKNLVYFVIRVKLEDYDNGLTSQIIIYRRFSQFEQFRARLAQTKLYDPLPPLPKKKMIGKTNKNEDHLFSRQTELESWLRLIGQIPNIMDDPTYQLFLTENAGNEPENFVFSFNDPNIVGRLSDDDDSSDEDSEEASFSDDDGSVEVIVKGRHRSVDASPGAAEAAQMPAPALPPAPPPPAADTTFAYQTIVGYGSGVDSTKRRPNATCIYYAIRVHSTTIGIKGVHEMLVYRRFSQFEKLRRDLLATKKYDSIPNLPKKKIFGNTSANTGHMMNRKNELTAWLRTVSDSLPNIAQDSLYVQFLSEGENDAPENYCPHGTFVQF